MSRGDSSHVSRLYVFTSHLCCGGLGLRFGFSAGRLLGFDAGLEGVEAKGQPAALAGGGVAVDRSLDGDFVEANDDLVQCFGGLLGVVGGEGGAEGFDVGLQKLLAGSVARVALFGLSDSF